MELRQLKYFLTVADAGSFVGAASSLFLSRQAVSKAISQLEQELGVELFMRYPNGAFLTPAGLMFYDKIRSSVKELEEARNEMLRYGSRYHQRIRMVLSVGVIGQYEKQLQDFSREENLELTYAECPDERCLQLLTEHEADLAVCTRAPRDGQFLVQTLASAPYGVLMRDSAELTETVELQDLTWLPLAGLDDGPNRELCKNHGLAMSYTGHDLYRLFMLTADGKCAMLLPKCMVPQMPGVRWLPLEGAAPWELYGVCLQSVENNVLYHTTLEALQSSIFKENAHV